MYESSVAITSDVMPVTKKWSPLEVACGVGVASADITPPIGIRAHNWGAARTGQATGVHRPLRANVVAIHSEQTGWHFLATVDLGWWQSMALFSSVFDPIVEALGVDRTRFLLHLVHTHAGPSLSETDPELPGSEHVEPFRVRLVDTIINLAREAQEMSAPSTITWAYGRCSMAVVRDLECGDRYVVGFDPSRVADDTVAVGRVCTEDGQTTAVLVNYACHPTTLAHENSLLSPDYIGAARELVERETGALCLFFQGASGDLAPREQYVPGTEWADRHGRSLGHAVLSTLESMGSPASSLEFAGVVESGAPLGIWVEEPSHPSTELSFTFEELALTCRTIETESSLEAHWSGIDELAARERIARASRLAEGYADGREAQHPVWTWRLGDAIFVAQPGEAYSLLQTELRRRHPHQVIFVLNLTNGPGFMYLPPASEYGEDHYQVWQSLLVKGSLEAVIEAADQSIGRLLRADVVASQ
jgi:hypothetical protein